MATDAFRGTSSRPNADVTFTTLSMYFLCAVAQRSCPGNSALNLVGLFLWLPLVNRDTSFFQPSLCAEIGNVWQG